MAVDFGKRVHVRPSAAKLALVPMPAYDGYLSAAEFDAGYANFITPEVVTHWEQIFRQDGADILTRLSCRQDLAYGGHERKPLRLFPGQGRCGQRASANRHPRGPMVPVR